MDFPEALKYLADKAGVKLERVNLSDSGDRERLIDLNSQALRFYNYLLTEHPVGKKALDYLIDDRGLKLETIKEFQLGFSPDNSYAFKKFLIDKKKFLPSDVERAGLGLIRGGNIYDRFNGRVIFPLFDHRGNPIGFAGRILPWDKRDTGKYINSPETPLYHKSNVLYALNLTRGLIKKKKVAIVVEGELDAISSYQAGIKNVVAIKGSALTEEQIRLLSRFAPKFILALDSDMAGDAAARRGLTTASNAGIEVRVAKITNFKDPDEAARGDLEGYKKDLIGAEGSWDYLIDSVFGRYKSETGSGTAKISKELTPILAQINDKIVQSHYINLVARKLNVPLSAVSQEVEKIVNPSKESPKTERADTSPEAVKHGRRDLLEERFLALSFQSDPESLIKGRAESLLQLSLNKRLLAEFKTYRDKHQSFNVSEFGAQLPPELFSGFSKMMLIDNEEIVENPDELKKELDLVGKELKIVTIRDDLKLLVSQMRTLEETGEKDQLLKAQNQFNKLAKSLKMLEEEDSSGIILSEP
jgi:DNA primase